MNLNNLLSFNCMLQFDLMCRPTDIDFGFQVSQISD